MQMEMLRYFDLVKNLSWRLRILMAKPMRFGLQTHLDLHWLTQMAMLKCFDLQKHLDWR